MTVNSMIPKKVLKYTRAKTSLWWRNIYKPFTMKKKSN